MIPNIETNVNICEDVQNKTQNNKTFNNEYPYYVHYRSYHRPFIR